ncbi:MAG: malate dehydrogenase [Dehalococcoidia bacterium]|nr:malate dehydrogenase [Dehalococcoidia bacterium]
MRKKVTIVGAGNTGAATAQVLSTRGNADVVLMDIVDGLPQGRALDIAQGSPWTRSSVSVTGTNDWADTANSDVIVVTSGVPRKPGMTREDLLGTNAGIVRSVIGDAVAHSPDTVFVILANPMDAMCHVALEASGFDRNRVVGQGGMLDSGRYRAFIAMESGSSVKDVSAWVLGGHTEATMVPITSNATVGGVPVAQLIGEEKTQAVAERAKGGGAEIVGLIKTGSSVYAPAAALVEMIEAILLDEGRVIPCCALLQGEYGINDAYVGVPVRLGAGGIQEVFEIPLSDDELAAMQAAGDAVKELVEETPSA